jgi:UDP-N-acetylmuramoylalanine--D-glutamate ligase
MIFGMQAPVAVVGLGATGKALMRLFGAYGIDRSQYVTFDAIDASADFNDPVQLLKNARPATLIVSPGVPLASAWIADFKKSGGTLTSEFDLCSKLVTSERIVAVTGSIGKSTCTSLLGEALRVVDPNVFIGGNLGLAWANYFADLKLGLRQKSLWQALEVSSYQIEGWTAPLNIESAILTYLSPNHLERYPSLTDYYAVKWALLKRAVGKTFVNGDCPAIREGLAQQGLAQKAIEAQAKDFDTRAAKLLGEHNKQNLSLALHFVETHKMGEAAKKAILQFKGLEHRCENLGERKGVLFVNDSKATAIDSVQAAINGLSATRQQRGGRLWVCLGGRDKKLPWPLLVSSFADQHITPIYFGECRQTIQKALSKEGPEFDKLSDVMAALPKLVRSGDIVLLSPGGTSLDEFKNFEERGSYFKSAIERSFA